MDPRVDVPSTHRKHDRPAANFSGQQCREWRRGRAFDDGASPPRKQTDRTGQIGFVDRHDVASPEDPAFFEILETGSAFCTQRTQTGGNEGCGSVAEF